MAGGIIIVSRAVSLYPLYEKILKGLGYKDFILTAAEKDGLDRLIEEANPRLLMMGSKFYEMGTPYMMGELLKRFPKLNTAAVSVERFAISKAVYFYWHGVRSYVDLLEGYEEFQKGLRLVNDGKKYISPLVKNEIEHTDVPPNVNQKATKRHKECLIMLCCGFRTKRIGENLHISRSTVENHLQSLYDIYHAESREEMVAMAWILELVTKEDIQFFDDRRIAV